MNSLGFLALCPLGTLLSFSTDKTAPVRSSLPHAVPQAVIINKGHQYVVLEDHNISLDVLVFYGVALTGDKLTMQSGKKKVF